MTSRDDMVFRPDPFNKTSGTSSTPAQRGARKKTLTQNVARRGRGMLRTVRRTQVARLASQAAPERAAGRGRVMTAPGLRSRSMNLVKGVKVPKRFGRALGAVGIAILAIELLITTGRNARLLTLDKSGRLTAAEDRDTVMGDLDEQAFAAAAAQDFLQSDPTFLRLIAQNNGPTQALRIIVAEVQRQALNRARGADMIDREPAFDAPNGLLELILKKVRESGLKEEADSFIRIVRLFVPLAIRLWFCR